MYSPKHLCVLLSALWATSSLACKDAKEKERATVGPQWYLLEILSDREPVPFELSLAFPLQKEGTAVIANGEQRISWPVACTVIGPDVGNCAVDMEIYGSKLLLDIDSRSEIQGIWERDPYFDLAPLELRGKALTSLEASKRFGNASPPKLSIAGEWRLELNTNEKGKAAFTQAEDGSIVGSLTPSELGDTDSLIGRMTGRKVKLSKFDGQRAYLVELSLAPDGKSFTGTWDLPGSERVSFTGYRGQVPSLDELYLAKVTSADGRVSIPELEKLRGKPVIVDLYGSWCPLCGDAVEEIKTLMASHENSDLEVLSIAYEATDNAVLANERVEAFHRLYAVPWKSHIRLGDVADALPPELGGKGFPITLFVNRDGTVRAMNTGFISKASKQDHEVLVGKFERWTSEIIASPANAPAPDAGAK